MFLINPNDIQTIVITCVYFFLWFPFFCYFTCEKPISFRLIKDEKKRKWYSIQCTKIPKKQAAKHGSASNQKLIFVICIHRIELVEWYFLVKPVCTTFTHLDRIWAKWCVRNFVGCCCVADSRPYMQTYPFHKKKTNKWIEGKRDLRECRGM